MSRTWSFQQNLEGYCKQLQVQLQSLCCYSETKDNEKETKKQCHAGAFYVLIFYCI